MKKTSAVLIILILPLITAIAFLPNPQVADAWGHQTHYFIVNNAVDNIDNNSWANAYEYYTQELLSGAVAPDQLWHAAGVMSHYYADPCIPVHTDVLWDGHAAYETDINNNLGEFTLTTPSETIVSNVSQWVVDNATYSNQYYDMVYDAYPTGEDEALATNSTIKTLTEDCLSMAIDGVLSLFYNLTLDLNAPDVTITYEYVAMIDFAHSNDYAPDELTAINMTLATNGYELIEQETAITAGSLSTVDLLIATCAGDAYTVDELSAISTWFQSGDKALLLTGRGDFDTYSDNLNMDLILIEIGSNIRINDDNVYMEGTYNPWYNDVSTIPAPADTLNLTYDVGSISFFSPNSLYFLDDDPVLPIIYADVTAYQTDQNPPESTVVYDDVMDGTWGTQIPIAAAEEIGTARLFVGGTTFFSDFDHGSAYSDNIQLLENFLEWATGNRSENTIADVDEIGPRISDIEWDPTSPDDGQVVNVSVTVTDPGGVSAVNLKYNNGTHDVVLSMIADGDDIYFAEILDVSNGSLVIIIEAIDNDANTAVRASYTITWTSLTTTTTTTTTTGGTPAPIDPLILFGAIAGTLVLIVAIIYIGRSRRGA